VTSPDEGKSKIPQIQKSVFISYRRDGASVWAQLISEKLTQRGYDVFFDFKNLASGGFEKVIFENIDARAHFIVLLTPSALERCEDPQDLFRREIEVAIEKKRNIVPIMLDGFDFKAPGIDSQQWKTFATLKKYNGVTAYPEYVDAAVEKLDKCLNISLGLVLHPVSEIARQKVSETQEAVAKAPAVTEEKLKTSTEQKRFIFTIKIKYQDKEQTVEGTRAIEPFGQGTLIIYDGEEVVARYEEKVERWARQPKRRLRLI